MSTDNSLRIKVGASLNSNVKSVYKPLIDVSKAAAKEVLAIWQQLSKDMGGTFTGSAAKVSVSTRKVSDDSKAMQRTVGGSLEEIKRKFEMMSQAAKNGLDLKSLATSAEAELRKVERAAARTQLGIGGGGNPWAKYGERTGYWSMRYFDNSLRTGARFAGSIARGAGIDFNIGSMVRNVAEQQMVARSISNEGYMPNDPRNSSRRTTGEIRDVAKETADYAGYDRSAALGGLQTFVGHTGDLTTGLEIIKGISKTARATGADLEDMVSAGADFSNVLGDIPNKGKEIEAVMRVLGGQAKTGAVSMRELPGSMVKLTSVARDFALSPETSKIFADQGVTTKVGQAVSTMGVLAQMAKFRGGATSASTATQAAMAFLRDTTTHSELSRWTAVGLNPFADAKHTQIKDPKRLIMEALDYSGGSLDKLSNIMPNRQSRMIPKAFLGAYNDAGGGEAGLKAVSDQYDKIAKSGVSVKEEQDSFDLAMKETVPKVQQFENKLQDTAEKISGKVLPVFEKLEPVILELTEKFGNMVAWAADNPGKAIVGAIVMSIGRAGLENALRTVIETTIKGAMTKGEAGGGLGIAGNIGAGLTIASLAIAAATIGIATIDMLNDMSKKDEAKVHREEVNAENAIRGAAWGKGKMTDEERIAELEAAKKNIQGRIDAESYTGTDEWGNSASLSPDITKNQTLLKSIDDTLRDLLAHQRAQATPGPPAPIGPPMVTGDQ